MIEELVITLPDGKKRKHLGNEYVQGLVNYYSDATDEEVDLDSLIKNDFHLLVQKPDFIKDILLFSREKLSDIYEQIGTEIPTNKRAISRDLITFFNLSIPIEKKEKRDFVLEVDCEISLHNFQERIRRKVINSIFNQQKRFLIHMPTGSGKTRTAAEIMLDFLRISSSKSLIDERIKILWIAQSSELCQQAYQTTEWIIRKKGSQNIAISHFYENHEINESDLDKNMILFCGIQKLLNHYTSPVWDRIRNDVFLVIVDEAHRSVAHQWIKALDKFVESSSVYLLGLTATPGMGAESDERNFMLSTYYHNNKISLMDDKYVEMDKPISYLTQRGFLAEIERIDIDSQINISNGISNYSDNEFKFSSSALHSLSVSSSRNSSIINIIRESLKKDPNSKILVFTCGIAHNRILNTLLNRLNISCRSIDQRTNDRQGIIDDFKNKDLNVLLNFGVLTTGFDAPKTNICIIARPVGSIVLYSQMVGRILRGPLNGGNAKNKLFTIKDNLGHGDYDELFNTFNEFYN
jgi:superfamily II DNA or RNA helicase